MPREENMLILKMLQDGTITAEQAAELLNALDASEARAIGSAAPAAPIAPAAPAAIPPPPAPVAYPPLPPPAPEASLPPDGEVFARARERIAAARERVAGMQERLTEAEEKLEQAASEPSHKPWEQMADALKDLPGARSMTDALRGIDPGKIVSGARRQARRVARAVRSSIGDLDIHVNLTEPMHGEPTFSMPREITTSVPAGGTLRLKNTLGDIDVQGADVPDVRVAGILKIWAVDKAAAELLAEQITLGLEEGSDGPTISVSHPERIRRVTFDMKVFVPAEGVKVSLYTLSGDVTARGLRSAVVLASRSGDARASEVSGDVSAETASGDIALEGVNGGITASSSSGDIQGIRLSGQSLRASTQSGDVVITDSAVAVVTIQTVSGDATAKEIYGRTLRIRAVSGDITVDEADLAEETQLDSVSGCIEHTVRGPLTAGSINLVTVSGDTTLKLPADVRAQIELSSKSGDMSAKFIGPDEKARELKGSGMLRFSEAIGKAGDGEGAKISLSSVSGDLSVEQKEKGGDKEEKAEDAQPDSTEDGSDSAATEI